MPTAAFATLGCKVNQYETQRILDSFEERGFQITEFTAPADVYVINTCSVTQAAERKSRQMVRRLSRQNPDAIVVMTGCYGEMAKIKGETVEEATLIVPNPEKLRTLDHLMRACPSMQDLLSHRPPSIVDRPSPARRTRATVKVQDGCNVFCSFCSIPYTRKVMGSRPESEVIAEVRKLADHGYREIVVTGVLVGSYGPETGSEGPDLARLLLNMASVPGIERVRLSSIEPTQVTQSLLRAFADEPKLCNHLHIPLQSGDTGILRAMNRPYDQDFYLRLCERAFRLLPDLAITSDIMVGFPGEDRAAFESTLHVSRTVGFARAHIFRYSPRPGTPAMNLKEQVSDEEKEARSHELAATCRETQQRYISRYLGKTLNVLVEGKEKVNGLLGGYTENYIKAVFTGGSYLVGTVTPVQLLEPTSDGALGEAKSSYQPEADIIPLTLVTAALPSNCAGKALY
jgi:threonylcarbamoyladenosine tRNA methylthiotransferase MtaB